MIPHNHHRQDDSALPYLTADLPGIGGRLKQRVEDFEVEEIPAYSPQGTGDFLYLWIEKRETSAEQLAIYLAGALGISRQEIGMAGLKDRQAVTRQQVSVPGGCADRVANIRHKNLRILNAVPHRHKLRTGHLRGNRFSILVRDVEQGALPLAGAIANRIEQLGFPNYFGEQRFGRDAETGRLGFDLLQGAAAPGSLPARRRKFLLRLALSAAQSTLFNQALAERMADRLVHRVLPGDVMEVVASRGKFVADDVEREQQRLDAGEIVITGPMFGPKMMRPHGEAAVREARLLETHQLTAESFDRFRKLAPGTRRPYLIRPSELSIAPEPEGLRFQFALPAGAYATVLLREFQKNDENDA